MRSFLVSIIIVGCAVEAYSQQYEQPNGQGGENSFSIFRTQYDKEISISSLAEWEQQRWEIQQAMEAVMGPLPDRSSLPNLEMRIKDTLNTNSYTRLTIDYLAAKGERVPSYLYIPKRNGVEGKLPAMVALMPTAPNGKKTVDGNGRANRGYAKELAERGYVVIAPDYPSFGDLKNYDFETDRYQSGTMAGIFYHMRSIDLLNQLEYVDADRIGVIGHSLGGHNAMFLAAFDSRPKVIVSSSGWNQFEYYDAGKEESKKYGGRLGPWAQERYMPLIRDKYELQGERLPFNFHEVIALIAPRVFFSNSPVHDKWFDVKGVEEGIPKSRTVYDFLGAKENLKVRYPDAEHDFPTEVRWESYEIIDEVLEFNPNKHEIE